MARRIQLRRDTAANWSATNPTLAQGEIGIDLTNGKLKIGTGTTAWNSLGYWDDKEFDLSAVAQDIVPDADNTRDLGSPAKQWRHVYTAGGSIYLDNIKLTNVNGKFTATKVVNPGEENEAEDPEDSDATSDLKAISELVNGEHVFALDETGNLTLNGQPYTPGGNANTGDVEFTGATLATPNTTEIDWPNGVIRLAPGSVSNPDLATYGQFLNIYPTTAFDAPHIHIAAGSGVNGKGDLLLGDDNQNIDVNNAGYITVKSYDPIRGQQNFWSFDKDGTLYGPGMGTVITNAISGAAGNDLFLSGGNNNVRQSRVVRFTDADGTAKSIYTVDTNIYYVDDISFTNGQPTLWIAPNENASIASITPGPGTATFDFGNPITLLADTDYTIDWYIVDNVTSVTIQSTIRQSSSYTRTTAPSVVSAPTVVWTGIDDWISSAKLTIQIEANEVQDPTGWHTQVCEAIIASRGNSGEPDITVYGVTHTSANPLMTFTAQRNVTTNLIEIVGTPTATVDGSVYLRIHSVEMLSRD